MKQNKADLLDQKIEAQHKLIKSQLVITKNVDARIEAIKNLLVTKGVFSEDEYQDAVDACLGLKVKKAEDETIAVGDIVWVSYVASFADKLEEQIVEKGIPLRVGSGAIPFEHELIGKSVLLKSHSFDLAWEGRTLKFLLDVNKVKTKAGDNEVLDAISE